MEVKEKIGFLCGLVADFDLMYSTSFGDDIARVDKLLSDGDSVGAYNILRGRTSRMISEADERFPKSKELSAYYLDLVVALNPNKPSYQGNMAINTGGFVYFAPS